jgi:hypothetical protein
MSEMQVSFANEAPISSTAFGLGLAYNKKDNCQNVPKDLAKDVILLFIVLSFFQVLSIK